VTKPGASPPNVTKAAPRPQQDYIAMYLAVKNLAAVEPRVAMSWIDRDIRDFLTGKTEGEDLLHALYDHVLDEPVPERLRALLKR
jgi:Anti-sigma factor NepR